MSNKDQQSSNDNSGRSHSFVSSKLLGVFFVSFFTSALNLYFNPLPTFADYTASITTSDSIILDAFPNETTVYNESISVNTNCSAGYNLTLATTKDSTLYQSGDSTSSVSINPVNPSYALSDSTNNLNTWGFSLANTPAVIGSFNPLSTTPSTIKTPEETAVPSGSISDIFSVYYGTNVAHDTPPGSYYMSESGSIVYQLTMAESCQDSLVIAYHENAGSDTVTNMPTNEDNTYDYTNQTVTLSNKVPVRSGYIFTSWNTASDGTGTTYRPGETVPMGAGGLSGFVDLYAIWTAECNSGYICYDGNGADNGTMDPQEATGGATVTLIATNYSRSGYGFAGWNTKPDGSGTQYGPNQNFSMPSSGGINLFAIWIKSTGTLQSWANASSMNIGDVIALKDSRDDEVYTVAKLADSNVWITENLRLVPNTSNTTAMNTNNPTQDYLDAYPSSSSSTVATGQCSTDDSTCVDQVRFNAHNLDRTLTPAYNGATNDTYWYSYGVMYNWYTATAGNGTYNLTSSSAAGDLCPAGWHLPTGGSSGEWGILANNMAGSTKIAKAATLRAYPNNFLYSGDYNPSKDIPDGVGKQGRIWSTTPVSNNIKNAYRMGYNSSEITATANSWNKWDNFAIRCIYQGGNIPFNDVTLDFAGSGITSVTFESSGFPTETATVSDPTVQIAENVPYTITATTSTGYELTSWATTSGGSLSSTTTNPTTYTVTSDTTLTATGSAVPTYTTTVELAAGVTSVSFSYPGYTTQTVTTDGGSVLLKRDIPYTITAAFDEAYVLDSWSTTPNGTIGDPTVNPTTYTITDDATLTITTKAAELLEYTLHYDPGTGGENAPADQTDTSYQSNYTFTIDSTTIPTLFGYHFIGYSDTQGSSTPTYTYDATTKTFTPSTASVASTGHATTKTLYAVYAEDTCPANRICYFDNGADEIDGGIGTMANQTASSNTDATLIPSNYSKSGYGFAGWQADGGNPGDPTNNIPATPPTVYGPNETITTPDISTSGLKLYAKWVESTGNLQGWNGCNSLSQGAVTALTDTRDNNTYAVAKLADDNCWLIENFRLDPATTTITAMNTHNPTSTFITQSQAGSGSSLSVNTMCNSNNSTCFDQLQYNTNSSDRSLTQTHKTDGNDVAWYAYGTYYNWYTATAGNGTYSTTSTSGPGGDGTVAGDICPLGWHLPSGNTAGEYNTLNTAINNGATNSDANWRKYPNNFVWSGDYNNVKRNSSYANGRLWTATAKDNSTTYRIGYKTNEVTASTNTFNKWDGFIVRCIKDAQEATFSDVTVTIPEGLDSITFQNSKYGEQTATTENPTVSLAQEATYTITANESLGYEFTSWIAGSNATLGDSSQNPTTLVITDNTTLTATTATRPSYQTTVTINSGVTSISFFNANYGTQTLTSATMTDNHDGTYTGTANLYKNIEYTITGTYNTADGYEFNTWSTTGSSTIGDATASTTTFTVTGTATLTLTSKQKTGQTVLLPGQELNAKMKTLAEGKSTSYDEWSSKIKTLRMADSLPPGFTPSSANTVSVAGSEKPIYIFFDNTNDTGIMNFYTEARDIVMNPDSSNAFASNTALTNIDGAINWDTSSVTNMSYMFAYTDALTNIDGAINWDTSSVTNMSYMFDYARALTNIDGAISWDTSSVTDMSEMFDHARALTNIDGAINWDTSSVTDMSDMFYNADSLTNIDGAINWDTSNVTDMSSMFEYATSLTNIDGAINWDTSSVTDMSEMFYYARALTNIDGAINWDTSSVTNMSRMFYDADSLTNIDGARNWDTGSVKDMRNMFRNANSNINGSAINNWDVRTVTATAGDATYDNNKFFCMFGYGPGTNSTPCEYTYSNHPEFTKRSGSWDTYGTFVPDDTTTSTAITATINFDSHISNIKLYGVFPGSSSSTTQTISTSGSTIFLTRGYEYRITATLDSGYELALWDPGEHGVIPPKRLALNTGESGYTYFYPTGDTTLTATSQPVPSDVTTTVNMDANIKQVSFCNDKYNIYNSSTENYDCRIASSNGSTVTLKQGVTYRVTAATKQGYEVSSYTATGGTVTSTTGAHTDFTPSSNSTLTVSTATKAPTHTVTVNMDSNVSYVMFTSNDWPSRTVISNGGTADIREGTTYNITAYTNTGYRLSTWSTTSDGTLGSTTSNPTTYTVSGDATLTTTTETIPSHQVTVNLDSNTTSVSFYNANYGIQTATSSNPNVSLREGVEYIITGSYAAGYEFSSWATSTDGTLGDTTSATTTFAVTGTATLSLTSQLIPTYSTTVNLASGVTSISFYNPTYGTQTIATSGDTATLRQGVEYEISASLEDSFEFNTWSTAAGGTLGSATANPTTYTVTSATSLTANVTDNRVLINYDGNGLYYDNDPTKTNNPVYYKNVPGTETVTKYAHTPNVSDAGVASGTYASNLNTTDTVTIDGATSLNVTIYYDAESTTYDWVSVYSSPFDISNNNDATVSTTTGNLSGKLSGRNSSRTTNYSTWYSKTYTVTGDTVKFHFKSDGSQTYYGYYAIVTAEVETEALEPISGTYAVPSSSQTHTFLGWSEDQNATTPTYTDENDILDNSHYTKSGSPVTLYAVYEAYDTVTVNFDSNITSVSFTNPTTGTQTVTTSGDTVTLRKNAQYDITATSAVGYEFSSWSTGSGGTLGSATDNPTTYFVTGDTTLTAISGIRPTYQTTITIDQGVTSLGIYNADYGTQTLTPATMTDNHDGTYTGTATLYKNIEYIITGTYNAADGYTFDTWSTTGSSTIGDATASTTTFTVTDTATLTLTSKQKTGQTVLLPGQELNAKMKTLAEEKNTTYNTNSSKIKALRMADSLPPGFTPSSANTVSVAGSEKPIYIFFDNTNDAGIMNFYTEARDVVMNPDSSYVFYCNTALTNIDGAINWDTSSVTDMSSMFDNARALTNIDALVNWDTSSVTDMSFMFYNARALTNIDGAINWDTSSVTSMGSMFAYANALTNIDGAINWDTSSVTKMSWMFADAIALTNIDGAINWDTSSVTDMREMFKDAIALTNIDGAINWDTSSVTDMREMFYAATALTNIDGAINWDTSSVTDMSSMFYNARALTNIDGAINWDTSSVTDMSEMFYYASALTNIDALANWDTSSVTDMSEMFRYAYALTNIDGASNWDTSNVMYMGYMFHGADSLTNIDALANWDTSSVKDMSYMFESASSLANIDGAINWDTSSVTNMSEMFYEAHHLTNIDGAINWDTSSVTNMRYMFGDTDSLTNIDGAINWDTSNVTNMAAMFDDAYALTNIDALVNWDTSSVTDMSFMFEGADSLTNIDALANWDTSSVTNMSYMFAYTDALTNTSGADNWDIRNVKATAGGSYDDDNNFYEMFYHAGSSSSSLYHPNFTKRSGTWDSSGTFIPDDTTTGSTTITATINFDSHISNIKLYGKFPGSSSSTTQTISTSGSTISLTRGYEYRITATLDSGYELALWDPGENGVIPSNRLTINSRTNDYTNFTPTGDTTLTATSQPVPSDVTTTVNMDANINQVMFCNDKYNIYNSSTENYDCRIASSNGSTVTLKQGVTYRVTAATKQGYEVSSYTATGGTVTSTAGAHTDFTPSSNSTLTVSSTTKAPTHTVTVNMDSNVSYVMFTSNDWPSRTVIRNGGTADIREGTTYNITAYTNTGYRLSTWSTTSDGTLGSTTSNPTTYTVSGDATLTTTTETIPSHQVTVNLDSNTTSVSFYNRNYGIQTATSSNPNVSLREGVEYIITGSYAAGYEFSSWSTSANGTLGDATSATTTYTVTGTATLSVTTTASGGSNNNNNNNTTANTNNTSNAMDLNAGALSSPRANTNTSTNSSNTTSNTEDENDSTIDKGLNFAAPQGVSTETKGDNYETDSALQPILLTTAAVVASGLGIYILAKRSKDDDEDPE